MKITFDTASDGNTWPQFPENTIGVLGKICVGPMGMLKVLETMLGLTRPDVADAIRAAKLVPALSVIQNAFWADSSEVDPLGVARRLLYMRDFLWMHGWREEPLEDRLVDLALLSKETMPGVPDRLAEVAQILPDCIGELPEIVLLEPLPELVPAWQEIFTRILAQGGVVTQGRLSEAPATGDLALARGTAFKPSKDGSLQLVRPTGMLQGAEDIAAWLAALNANHGLAGTVIVGGDVVLDNTLNRYGLPTTGAMSARYHHSLLQLLPLVLAMGWSPPDENRILELLTLPACPVPPSIGRRLLGALSQWPAMGSSVWDESLTAGLDAIDDIKQRQRVEDRLNILFAPASDAGLYPVTEIIKRVNMLEDWLRGRYQGDEVAASALSQCRIFLEMVDAMGLTEMSEPLLRKILDQATGAAGSGGGHPAQAGLAHVSNPEAIIGPAERIVWWSFYRDAIPAMDVGLFRTHERKALSNAGISLPDPGRQAMHRAERWRRPLMQATNQLILVCPKIDEAGEELHPHPLWDELLAASDDKARKLIVPVPESRVSPALFVPVPAALPMPESRWQVKVGTIKPRDCESPSSLENLFGCPLKWALHYIGRIRSGNTAALPHLVTVLGSMAHELIEEILSQPALPTPEDGAAMAGRLFDDNGPLMVASLFQKGQEVEKHKAKNTLVTATRGLLQHLHDAGSGALETEKQLNGSFNKQNLTGRADLVLSRPFTVVDLKRSWSKGFRNKLTSGTALQLVVYANLLKQETGVYPEMAYFTIEDQSFITTDAKHFQHADVVAAPATQDVWKALKTTFRQTWGLLKNGEVLSPGNGDAVKSQLEGESLIMEAPCRFCDYDVLCGQRLGGQG